MSITYLAFLISTILSGLFSARIYYVKKKYPDDTSKEFFNFFFFGFLYFFTRLFAISFFLNDAGILSLSYLVSHLFLYLSFSFMLETAFSLSFLKKYSKRALYVSIAIGSLILFFNYLNPNIPYFDHQYNIIRWGTNHLVSILHIIYGMMAISAISYIFIHQAIKSKPFSLKLFLVGAGFAFLLLNILKNFAKSGAALFFFELVMIIGISIIAIGLTIKEKN